MSKETGEAHSILLSFAACRAEEDNSGVTGTKKLTELSAAEARAICDYVTANIPDQVKLNCRLNALTVANTPADCENEYSRCIEREIALPDCADTVNDAPDCASTITVDDFEACIDAQAEENLSRIDNLSCTSTPDEAYETETPAACHSLQSECPELFGTNS